MQQVDRLPVPLRTGVIDDMATQGAMLIAPALMMDPIVHHCGHHVPIANEPTPVELLFLLPVFFR